jgi:hypothetical protein
MLPIPPTAYIIAAALVLGLGLGAGATYKIQRGNVLALELAIATANSQADAVMSTAKEDVAKAENKAVLANKELDDAQSKFVETVNSYDKQLDTIKLYSNYKASCPDSLSASDTARISKEASSYAEYAENLDRVIKEKAAIADEAAEYAMNAYKFAYGLCGTKK